MFLNVLVKQYSKAIHNKRRLASDFAQESAILKFVEKNQVSIARVASKATEWQILFILFNQFLVFDSLKLSFPVSSPLVSMK